MTRLALAGLVAMVLTASAADSLRTMDGSGSVTWSILKPGPYRVTETLLLEPAAEFSSAGSWVLHTKRHGAVDLDDLLDRIDSVLAGERRK